jgi:hypothetical protein
VELPSDAVAHEGSDDRAALRFGELLNGRADVAEPCPITNLRDAKGERVA